MQSNELSSNMSYMDWCEFLLKTINDVIANYEQRRSGIEESALGKQLFGDRFSDIRRIHSDVLFDAAFDLYKSGLMVDPSKEVFWKLTREGRKAAKDLFTLWEEICSIPLDSELMVILSIINRSSPKDGDSFASVIFIDVEDILKELNNSMGFEEICEALRELKSFGLVFWDGGSFPDSVRSTYKGLVWHTRRDLMNESKFIDTLVEEWETTSIEFKRELQLETADQKAKFIREIISLANTQASGKRWLIIGFEDKNREYYGPPNSKVDQERIERIVSEYTEPFIDTRYKRVKYKQFGEVGLLEILRDSKKLPYKVSKSLGEKKAGGERIIKEGQIFVRHGSQIEEPSQKELDAIYREAERAQLI